MAEINTEKKQKKGKNKAKKMSTRTDMTPMVDLACLLITFFMLSTTLSKPQTMEIVMPSKDKVKTEQEETKVKASTAITILLGKNDKVYYYFGLADKAKLVVSSFAPTGLRSMLLNRNAELEAQVLDLKKQKVNKQITPQKYTELVNDLKAKAKTAPVIMIKPSDLSTYNNLVDVLDEMQICNIAAYAIVPIKSEDIALIKKADPQSGFNK